MANPLSFCRYPLGVSYYFTLELPLDWGVADECNGKHKQCCTNSPQSEEATSQVHCSTCLHLQQGEPFLTGSRPWPTSGPRDRPSAVRTIKRASHEDG